jgi:probable sporulation protein (polysaccharide deacetylase family)
MNHYRKVSTLLCIITCLMSTTLIGAKEKNLKDIIKQHAHKQEILAIEPRVDPVWHLIPGYNGVAVDLKKTIRASTRKNRQIIWITKEIKPLTTLNNFLNEPIYKGNPHKKMVALLINVAWGESNIPRMLRILKSNKVKATFFLDGQWLEKHEREARLIINEGHQVSNHAYSHKNMSRLSETDVIKEIQKTQKLLRGLGVTNNVFAPPSGDFSSKSLATTAQLGLHTILWTVDTIDWREKDHLVILQRVIPRIEPGSMVLMHPTQSATAALDPMIKQIKLKKLRLGTVNELISTKRVEVE